MKYLLFIILLAAVLITAGCVSGNTGPAVTQTQMAISSNDPIIGIWQWTVADGSKMYTFTFFSDGRYSFTDSSDPNTLPGNWSKVRNNEYLIVYTSGKNQAIVYNPTTDTFSMPEFSQVLVYRLGKEPAKIYTSTITANPPSVTTIQTENTDAIQTQLNGEGKQIRDIYDSFTVRMNKLDLNSNDGINELRETNIPNAISEYQKVKNDLLKINIDNSDLKNERNVLVSISEYKIKFLQGLSSAYHCSQAETFDIYISLDECKKAKNYFQDMRDAISVIPYTNKYSELINRDDQSAKDLISIIDQKILRISKLVK
jgi:hypothetical protein